MNDKIKQKYKDLFITLIEEDDWAGARSLLDNIIDQAAPSQTITQAPPMEQVQEAPPQGTSFDDERQARLNQNEAALKN